MHTSTSASTSGACMCMHTCICMCMAAPHVHVYVYGDTPPQQRQHPPQHVYDSPTCAYGNTTRVHGVHACTHARTHARMDGMCRSSWRAGRRAASGKDPCLFCALSELEIARFLLCSTAGNTVPCSLSLACGPVPVDPMWRQVRDIRRRPCSRLRVSIDGREGGETPNIRRTRSI
jgi:hypothetical protein